MIHDCTCEDCGLTFKAPRRARTRCGRCALFHQTQHARERRLGIRPASERSRTPDERWRIAAGRYVVIAKELGVLPKLGVPAIRCVDCGDIATEYDHRDYSRPLDVEPVCSSCNKLRGSAKAPTYKQDQAA